MLEKKFYKATRYVHVPKLEDFWKDCIDENEVFRRGFMWLTLSQMLNFNVISSIPENVIDDSNLVNSSYQNASLPLFQWPENEEEMDIKGKTSQVLDRSQAWLERAIKSHSSYSSQKGTPKETSTIAQASQRVVGKPTSKISTSRANSQPGGDDDPPEKNKKLKSVCETGSVTPPKKNRTSLQISSSEEDTQFLHQLGEQNPFVSLVDDVDPQTPPSDVSLLTLATTINTLSVKSPANPSSTPWLKKAIEKQKKQYSPATEIKIDTVTRLLRETPKPKKARRMAGMIVDP